MSKKILFITCDRVKIEYGITSGLYNSAKFVVDYLSKYMNSKLVSVTDGNGIDKVVTEFDPDIVVLEALWVSPLKLNELVNIPRHKKRKWIIRIHSKAPFLANEGVALKWISEYILIDNVLIAPNTRELTEQLRFALPYGEFIYLPNIYKFEKFEDRSKLKNDCFVNIGCFGAIRPMKNTFHQALACIEFAELKNKTLRFHVNTSRIEQSGESVVKNLRSLFENNRHELVEHKWYHHKDFLSVVSEMDMGVQVSFTESFNIVTADFVAADVPIIVGEDIGWMPDFLKCRPTSQRDLVNRLKWVYNNKWISKKIQKIFLHIYNYKAKLVWRITV
jgi:hypothetical protein